MKIFLIEDMDTNISIFKKLLNKIDSGHDLEVAKTKADAISLIKANEYDLYIIDGNIGPSEYGWDLVESIFLTNSSANILSFTTDTCKENFEDKGVTLHLSKPLIKGELESALQLPTPVKSPREPT